VFSDDVSPQLLFHLVREPSILNKLCVELQPCLIVSEYKFLQHREGEEQRERLRLPLTIFNPGIVHLELDGGRPGEDVESFRSELRVLAEALHHLFHALLLHEVGLSRDLLLKALTRGGIGSMSVIPALRQVGIELPAAPEE
jgi:hypothetical protein